MAIAGVLLSGSLSLAWNFQFQKLAGPIPGAEGPVVDSAGHIFMVCPGRGQVLWIQNGRPLEIANTGGVPAGLQIDEKGRIWIADMKLGILRLETGRKLVNVATEFEGKPMRGCNDLALDSRGRLYFTAPAGSSAEQPVGEVYWRDERGNVRRFDAGLAFPNGIAVSEKGRFLVYAETMTRKLWRWELDADGKPVRRSLFATLPGKARTGADGMDFDANGSLLVTNHGEGSLDVFGPDGNLSERIPLPFQNPSNVDFAPDGSASWLATEHQNNALWSFQWRYGGMATRKIGAVEVP